MLPSASSGDNTDRLKAVSIYQHSSAVISALGGFVYFRSSIQIAKFIRSKTTELDTSIIRDAEEFFRRREGTGLMVITWKPWAMPITECWG